MTAQYDILMADLEEAYQFLSKSWSTLKDYPSLSHEADRATEIKKAISSLKMELNHKKDSFDQLKELMK